MIRNSYVHPYEVKQLICNINNKDKCLKEAINMIYSDGYKINYSLRKINYNKIKLTRATKQ